MYRAYGGIVRGRCRGGRGGTLTRKNAGGAQPPALFLSGRLPCAHGGGGGGVQLGHGGLVPRSPDAFRKPKAERSKFIRNSVSFNINAGFYLEFSQSCGIKTTKTASRIIRKSDTQFH